MINERQFLDNQTKTALWQIVLDYRQKREKSLLKNDLERERFREELFQIKKSSLSQINQLSEKAIHNLQANGITVFKAKDDEEARQIIEKILKTKSHKYKELKISNCDGMTIFRKGDVPQEKPQILMRS